MAVTRTCGWRQSNPGSIPSPDMSSALIQEPSSQSASSTFQRWGRTVGGSEGSWVAVSAPKVTHWRGQSHGCFHSSRTMPGRLLPRKSNPQYSRGTPRHASCYRLRSASSSRRVTWSSHSRRPRSSHRGMGRQVSYRPLATPQPSVGPSRGMADMQRVQPFVVGRWTHGRGRFPVIQAPRRLRHQRPVSRYCRHSRSPARGGACTCTAAQSRPTPFSVQGRSNVCWS